MINGKRYIGSAENLTNRLTNYFSISYLKDQNKRYNSKIYRAILKYGFNNFSLEIILYCKIEDLLEREKHYIDLLIPEYNISLETGAPMRGRKHSKETLKKMSASQKALNRIGENHPMFGLTGQASPLYGRDKPEGSGRPSQQISVIDKKTNQTTTYDSMREAARALDLPRSSITDYFKQNQVKPYKGRYIFTKVG